jgi:hypothetical protein
MTNFETITRSHGEAIAHKTLPVWIVHYDRTKNRAAHYQAYKATAPLIKGQHPCLGGVDNRRIGGDDGFETLEAACAAAEAA